MASSFIIYILALLGPITGLSRHGKVYSKTSVYKQSPTNLASFSKEYHIPKSQSVFNDANDCIISQLRMQAEKVELFGSKGHEDISQNLVVVINSPYA